MKIMLDPGHGAGSQYNRGFRQVGKLPYCNEGSCNYNYCEYYLKPALERYGIEVELTRKNILDNPSLAKRGKMAKGYDLLISCHSNAANGKASGVEIWDSTNPKESIKDLTDKICKNISETLDIPNRGTKYRRQANGTNYYGVLRNGQAKHNFIIEHCFHDNPSDVEKYRRNLGKVADAVADAIGEYFNLNAIAKMIKNESLFILETPSTNVYQQFIEGKTLRELGAYGINGSFFDTPRPQKRSSIWAIAMNGGVTLGENADRVSYDPNIRRGTLAIYEDGRCEVKSVNNINEIKGAKVAVSGVSLTPNYDPEEEKVASDILRRTWHTAIAYKGETVYLIVSKRLVDMFTFKQQIDGAINPDGAIALDGGGSSEFNFKDVYHGSGRKLCTMIGIKKF